MKRFVSLLIVIALAVLVTTLAHNNPAKVTVFLTGYRIDFSLNFAIVALFLAFFGFYVGINALKASGQLPGRIRRYWQERKQENLHKANTEGVIALITGDEEGADKALKQASKTGLETDLSYLLRAMSALQADDLDLAETILKREKAASGHNAEAVALLRARIALAKGQFEQTKQLLADLPSAAQRLPQVKKTVLLSSVGLQQWSTALEQYRTLIERHSRKDSELEGALGKIYRGLALQAQGKPVEVDKLFSKARAQELQNPQVLRVLSQVMTESGLAVQACKMLEKALSEHFSRELLTIYHPLAIAQPRQCLPFVEKLLEQNPQDVCLLELAAHVCEKDQLWGKAIARFEKLYQTIPSAHCATQLEQLYLKVNQPEKARQWQMKANQHSGANH